MGAVGDPREQALERLYRAHFAFVWRSLRRLGVREADLGDAVHDTFLVVYRRLEDFDGQCQPTTWLYGICFRVASDRRRRASNQREQLVDPPSSAATPAFDDRNLDRRRLLQHALDAMPDDQRAVFSLFELEGWSGEAIAEAVGVPVATVHSRLRLARLSFKKSLAAWDARERFDQQTTREVR